MVTRSPSNSSTGTGNDGGDTKGGGTGGSGTSGGGEYNTVPEVKQGGTVMLGVPGRKQYDQNNGYCGELTLQMLMLKHGAWIPQEVARSAGGGELLLGINYDRAMDRLRISREKFTGRDYKSFFSWAKQKLRQGYGVVTVAYFKGARNDGYDHIMPIVGVRSSGDGYNASDTFYVHSNYAREPVERKAGDYWCTAGNRKDSILRAGCVPQDTKWGYAIKGPTYAGIGPRTELSLNNLEEPGLGKSTTFKGTLRIRGLQSGRSYKVHVINELSKVPASAGASVGGQVVASFAATGGEKTLSVSFQSGKPAYFICV